MRNTCCVPEGGLDGCRRNAVVFLEMTRLKHILLTGCGAACVALGVAGIFLPVMPTTPFLLLAAVCYARSSPRFYRWLITNRWCGAYIRNYWEGRGISRLHKSATLLLLWLGMGATITFFISLWWLKLVLAGIAVAVTVHVLLIRTCQPASALGGRPAVQAAPEGPAMVQETAGERKATA